MTESVGGDGDERATAQPGDGVAVHRKPLSVLVHSPMPAAEVAPLITPIVDKLIDGGLCDFAPVAMALQDFVVAHQPTGVAALLDVGPEPILFLFDQARATAADGRTWAANGREGWTTEVVEGT